MKIKITLQKQINTTPVEIEVEQGTTIEALFKEYENELPYTVMGASIDNQERELTDTIDEPCSIKFLDMRSNSADRMYQRSLCLLYLKSVQDILGEVDVDILNSLNRGLFTMINTSEPVTDGQLSQIESRMRKLVAANVPFTEQVVSRDQLLQYFQDDLSSEKYELLKHTPDIDFIAICGLESYRNYFYGRIVPSTGYLQHFELKRYEDGVLLRYPHPMFPDEIPPYVNDKKLYEAFTHGWKIAESFGLAFAGDLNREIANGKIEEIINLFERLHTSSIKKIAKTIVEKHKRVLLLAGPSSSGKTTSSKRICKELNELGHPTIYIGTDDYYCEREDAPLDANGEPNFEGLDSIDVELFESNINDLLEGKEVDIPHFNFVEGKKEFGKRLETLADGQIIVIEGIHALNASMTGSIPDEEKYKVYISPLSQLNIDDHNRIPTTDVRLIRRMARDVRTRNSDATSTITTWPKVRRGEDVNIFPYNGEADVILNSSLIYELAILKTPAEKLLKQVHPDSPAYIDALRLLDFLKFFNAIDAEEFIPGDSILREFIGGSTVT